MNLSPTLYLTVAFITYLCNAPVWLTCIILGASIVAEFTYKD